MVTNLRYADDIILLATSELVDRLDQVSRKYSLLINIDKTKVMASNGIACSILIQNEQLEQVDRFLRGGGRFRVPAPMTAGPIVTLAA